MRHTTRNFPNREGSKPGEGQFAGVCLMDARSIAATAANGGRHHRRDGRGLHAPSTTTTTSTSAIYDQPCATTASARPTRRPSLSCGPNITDWPEMYRAERESARASLPPSSMTRSRRLTSSSPPARPPPTAPTPCALRSSRSRRRVPEYVPRAKEIAKHGGGAPRRRRARAPA